MIFVAFYPSPRSSSPFVDSLLHWDTLECVMYCETGSWSRFLALQSAVCAIIFEVLYDSVLRAGSSRDLVTDLSFVLLCPSLDTIRRLRLILMTRRVRSPEVAVPPPALPRRSSPVESFPSLSGSARDMELTA